MRLYEMLLLGMLKIKKTSRTLTIIDKFPGKRILSTDSICYRKFLLLFTGLQTEKPLSV